MSTDRRQERLAYVLRRKEFLNQKSFDIFEKLQIGIFAYVAYVFGILNSYVKKEWTLFQAQTLIGIADIFLGLLAAIFTVFEIINVVSWWRYENEENNSYGQSVEFRIVEVARWIEFWIILAALAEILATYVLKNHSLILLS